MALQNPVTSWIEASAPRFLWLGAAAFSVLAVFAIAFAANWTHKRESEFRIASVERALSTAGEHATQLFARMDGALLAALADLAGRRLSEVADDELDAIRARALAGAPTQMRLQFWGPQGEGRGEFRNISIADRDYFLFHTPARRADPERVAMIHAGNGLFIGVPVKSRITGLWTMPVSRPIVDREGDFVGVINASYPIDTFLDLYAGMRDAPTDLVALWRNDRTMLVRVPFDEARQSRRFENAPVWNHHPAIKSGHYEAPTVTDGITRVVVFRGLEPLPLLLVYAIERSALTLDALRTYWPLLFIALAAISVAILYAFLSARYAVRLVRSVSELRASQAQTRLAADARGRLIANMNHELRTPLNAIMGFSEVLSAEIYGKLGSPKYKEYAADIHESGGHLLSLIDDVIDFSAIDLGKRELTRERVELADAVRAAMRLLQPQAQARRIRIDLATGLPAVLSDARATRQVLTNLLSNAVKFSPADSTVRVDPAYGAEGRVGIEIVDSGPGIPADELARIGEPFFRGRDAERSAIGGSGLGVSISKALAKQMDGRVEVGPAPGGGTRATLLLVPAISS